MFNTQDMRPYYYIAGGFVTFGLLCGLSLAMWIAPKKATPSPKPVASISAPKTFIEKNNIDNKSIDASSSSVESGSETYTEDQFLAQLKSAEEQPTYELKSQAYQLLLENQSLSGRYLEQAKTNHTKYKQLFDESATKLQTVQTFMDREYYSDAIRQSQALIKEGPILGTIHEEAQQLLNKAYVKKIDYFLIQGKLSSAKAALKAAESNQVSAALLSEYSEKIKNLELAAQ